MASKGIIDVVVAPAALPDVAFVLPRYRPHIPIMLACADDDVARRVMLFAGVVPFVTTTEIGAFIPRTHAMLVKRGLLKARDRVAYISGGGGTLSLSLHGG